MNYNVSDYYPGGMTMPGRSLNSSAYRYGAANGQEKSTEINSDGNLYTAEYWQYDSRIGRRWNVDPIPKAYESPYATFANNPIFNIDPNGSDTLRFTQNTTIKKEVRMKSNLDGAPSKVVMPGSTTTTGNIDITQSDGPDVFYYQHNTTVIDENGVSTTTTGAPQQFNPTGSSSNFYRTGGFSGIMGPYYDDRNVLAMLAPRWLLDYGAARSQGPQKWAYQTAIANQSDLPFINGLQNATNAAYTISGAYGVFRFALSELAVTAATKEGIQTTSFLSNGEWQRIHNAATRIGRPITVVGSRASGTAGAYSDWDYVIEGLKSREWDKIKNSLPGSRSVLENTPRNIDIFKGPVNVNSPYITIYPR